MYHHQAGAGWTRRSRRRISLGQAALFLSVVAGVGFSAAAGCGHQPGTEGAGGATVDGPVGLAKQGLVSAQVCVNLRRQSVGTIFDALIQGRNPPRNHGSSMVLTTGVYAFDGLERRALIRFDLSGIPAGPSTNITLANLVLTQGIAGTSGPANVDIHRVTVPWTESTVTWQSFNFGFDPTPVTSFSNAGTTYNVDVSALVAGWVHGTDPNDGFIMMTPGGPITNFWSSEYLTVTQRPQLDVCYTVTCAPGFADCNHDGTDGCEVDLGSSAGACGACGNVCVLPNAAPACVNGACEVVACNQGFGDCNAVASDGCETLLATNADCGACGVSCVRANGAASCAAGTCTLVGCDPGFFDCDGDPSNGCEALPCGDGQQCQTGADCASGNCVSGVCAGPTCTDVVKNGSETDVDCGGGACPGCVSGQTCNLGTDCLSGSCVAGVCQAGDCVDLVKNGSETDVDCGGGACPGCVSGQTCNLGTDCLSGVCVAGVCQAPACTDGVLNGAETAIDCGGGVCPACVPGKGCNIDADCQSGVCLNGVCQLPSCADGIKNGGETDIDCGGPVCQDCNDQQACTAGADCQSGVCVSGVCQPPSCADGVKNGDETGVDCGGACFTPEVCNGLDDDCNGLTDDGLGTTTCGIGACQVTVQSCAGGQVQTCVPLASQPEVMDGLDNDCNGIIDDGPSCVLGAVMPCYSGAPASLGVGECHGGAQTCGPTGWGPCQGEVTPVAEACDGLDNDCNGADDDALGQSVCGVGACQVATPNCVNGQPATCTPLSPTGETCDGLDNDCDGVVDNGLGSITCGMGECQASVPACENGQPGACVPLPAQPETCNGLDDDCDGVADEGNPGGGGACSTGLPGICGAGVSTCNGGQLGCVQAQQPSAELCNGLDDDCDGVVDNNAGGGACSTGVPGACSAGVSVCTGGQLTCQQTVQPVVETCNGLDDDCDGVIDDGDPGGGAACDTGLLGACAEGVMACAGGGVSCIQAVFPAQEQWDGLDNDCNGVVDDAFQCLSGQTNVCYTGAAGTMDIGACRSGLQSCVAGSWGPCQGEVTPVAESCDGLDDDCNGQVDDGLGTLACGVGQCANSAPACVDGQPGVCAPLPAQPETCDGLDNDCDGVADEGDPGGGGACSTGIQGICGAGTTSCVTGALLCSQNVQPQVEACDGLDNNCDGQVDEGNPDSGSACDTGVPGACAAGITACSGGMVICPQTTFPVTELLDGIDNDCNGVVDDVHVCNDGETQACYDGPAGTQGVGICHAGVQTCAANAWGACAGEVWPAVETCNGLDDDCDGALDDGNPGGGGACDTGLLGVCQPGAWTCTAGAPACVGQVGASPEVWDGLDNDCNGIVDDPFQCLPGDTAACYTGPAGAVGIGSCQTGTMSCAGGTWSPCVGDVVPATETCNGADDDCNGVIDDGSAAGASCDTGLQGVCAGGTTVCTTGQLTCQQNVQADAETCNGLDDNCDGTIDEGDPEGGAACDTGLLGVCAAGTLTCTAGSLSCIQDVPPSQDIPDGLDNDCNGVIDDAAVCQPSQTQSCYSGAPGTAGVGVCKAGTQSCVNGNWGPCDLEVVPTAEQCDGLDNDCNGQVDDGFGTLSCGVGACAVSVNACQNGQMVPCTPGTPQAETCNATDDDCDGVVDDSPVDAGMPCTTGLLGICATGTNACVAGALACNQNQQAQAETCNGLDDNCNGTVDDGVKTTFYLDADDDNYGLTGTTTQACSLPAGYAAVGADCNDGNAAVHPGAAETCNTVDDDCDGSIDEGVKTTYYRDADNDTYGSPTVTTQACTKPTGYVTNNTDCNDSNASVRPGATETCNHLDDDCDGAIDESGCSSSTCSTYTETFGTTGAPSNWSTTYYKATWGGNYSYSPHSNMALCNTFQTSGAGIRQNAQTTYLWISKNPSGQGVQSCTSATITYNYGQSCNAGGTAAYTQSNDASYPTWPSSGYTNLTTSYLNTSCTSNSTCTSQYGSLTICNTLTHTCNQSCGTQTITVPFGTKAAVYVQFKTTTSNCGFWYDTVQVKLNGCSC